MECFESAVPAISLSYAPTFFPYQCDRASMLSLTATLTLNEMIKIKIGRITSIIITLTVLSFHQI